MKKLSIAAALTVGALTMMSTAGAADPWGENDNPSGPYVGASVGRFNLHVRHLDAGNTSVTSITASDDNSWKVFGGYRFNPYIAIEGDYIDFGSPNDRFTATGSNGNYRIDLSGFAPYVVGSVPLGPVELFAKVGYVYYNVDTRVNFDSPGPGQNAGIDTSHTRSDIAYGGGIGTTLFQHLNIKAEYEVFDIDNAPSSNAVWLTAAWRF